MKLCKNLRFFITLALVCCVANWTPEIENNIKDYISNELPSVYGVCFKFGQIEVLFAFIFYSKNFKKIIFFLRTLFADSTCTF